MSGQMIQIVILAGVALFLVLQLRRVLGTRDGFEPTDEARPLPPAASPRRDFEVIDGGSSVDLDIADHADIDSETGKALASMKAAEPGFVVSEFTSGARQAYEMILMAFEHGDLETLNDFLSPDVYESFASAVRAREEQGLSVEATFVGVREVKLVEAEFDEAESIGEITMRFVGELTSVVKDSENRIVEGDPNTVKKQRDTWTFARSMGSDNPNWLLVATEK